MSKPYRTGHNVPSATEVFRHGLCYSWRRVPCDASHVSRLASTYHLSLPIIQTLVGRGYVAHEDITEFLFTSSESVANADRLHDAHRAVNRLQKAVEEQEKILIAGDYDVDGMTATALVMACCLQQGARVNFFLPHRVRDGYGLSPEVVERAARNGYRVIVTVDNGITAFEAAQAASDNGIDLIITDHHQPHHELPQAYAIVNPNHPDCSYPDKGLAGVGVAWKLMQLWSQTYEWSLPESVYHLMLFGTVADVVPLTGENRFWVRQALQRVNTAPAPAVRVLCENARCSDTITSLDVGYALAPQLNALGRLEDPRDAVKFLVGDDVHETQRIGAILRERNAARRDLERQVVDDVTARIERGEIDVANQNMIVAVGDTWQPGVIGLAASRLVQTYHRPTFLLHKSSDGLLKGSCRSIPSYDIFQGLSYAGAYLEQFGGHTAAAGLSLRASNLDAFMQAISEHIATQLTPDDFVPTCDVDGEILLSDLGQQFMHDVRLLEPFGADNERPLFVVRGVTCVEPPALLKERHCKLKVFGDGVIKSVIFFNNTAVYKALCDADGAPFDLVGHVIENKWKGRVSIELQGVDIAFSSTSAKGTT